MTREESIYVLNELLEKVKASPNKTNILAKEKQALEYAIKAVERPCGEWVEVGFTEDYREAKYRCTKCKTEYKYTDFVNIAPIECFPNFCPNCGADMRKESEAE